jgi:subtilisin family serine protease
MSAELAWDCAGPGQPILVAVIDSGIARAHPDLAPRISPLSRRIMGGILDNAVEDADGHGTFLAGTIAAVTHNALGVASATWPVNLGLLAVKFYDPWHPLNAADAAHAVQYAVDAGARVINASWHVGMYSQALFDAVQYAAEHDVLFVAAAGNEGTSNDVLPVWPACFCLPNVISVMATARPPVYRIDNLDDRPGFSNYGPTTVHLAAPGTSVLSTHYHFSTQPARWRHYRGTSAAAAQVTAAAALVRALRPAWTAPQVRAHLMASVDASRYLKCIAGGRLNLERAVCGLP